MKYHLTLWLEWLSSKRTQITNVGEDVERKKTLVPCWLEWTYVQPLWKTVWKFLKKWKKRTTTWSSSPTPGHIFGENTLSKSCLQPLLMAALLMSAVHGSALSACERMSGERRCFVYKHTHWDATQPLASGEIFHLEQHRWTWRALFWVKWVRERQTLYSTTYTWDLKLQQIDEWDKNEAVF